MSDVDGECLREAKNTVMDEIGLKLQSCLIPTKSLKSPRRRKLISARCSYIFLLPIILLEGIKWSFQWPGLELSNVNQERKSTFEYKT